MRGLLYYSIRVNGCSDAMFSFGVSAKRNVIGNLQLPREKYLSIKNKLLDDMRGMLRRDKRIFSIFDLVESAKTGKLRFKPSAQGENFNKGPIEQAFTKTASMVLGKPLCDIDSYAPFLQKHVYKVETVKSRATGSMVIKAECFNRIFAKHPKLEKRVITEKEILSVGDIAVEEKGLENISMDLDKLAVLFSDIAFMITDTKVSKNINIKEAIMMADTRDCYKGADFVSSKKCAYVFWPRNSENIFGSSITWQSSFCLKGFYSKSLSRCFEVDSCESCSDLYYSHNCENVHDSMFCFNTKNLRNAIGNVPLQPAEYKKAKASIQEQIADELETKKDLKWDIYCIGCHNQ